MLWGGHLGQIEIRAQGGETHLRARFPYGAQTELAPGRHEVIAPGAFSGRIEAGEDIHLLAGHDWEKPLASRAAGTLDVRDTPEGVAMEARIASGTSWARDFLAAHASGLIRGLSPGFRVQPGGERIETRGAALLRTVTRAQVFEFSAVTVPAYPAAQIEARTWETHQELQSIPGAVHPFRRWRA